MTLDATTLRITPEVLSLIAEIDEFKGAWRAIGRIAPEQLTNGGTRHKLMGWKWVEKSRPAST